MFSSIFKAFFWLAVITAISCAAMLYYVPKMITPEKMRSSVSELYSKATGKHMEVRGGITITLLPQPHLQFSDVTLTDPKDPKVGKQEIKRLNVRFSMMQALRNRIAISFDGEVNGQNTAGTANLPTVARHNSGRANKVELHFSKPFRMDLSGTVQALDGILRLTDVSMAFDETKGTGELIATAGEKGNIYKGEWKFPVLNVDEVLRGKAALVETLYFLQPNVKKETLAAPAPAAVSPAPESAPASTGESKTYPWPDTLLPLTVFATMIESADVSITADILKYHGYSHEQVEMKIRDQSRQLSLAITKGTLYGGTGTALVLMDVSMMLPFIRMNLTLHDADIGAFMASTFGIRELEGQGDVTLEIYGTGYTVEDFITGLGGTGSITLKEGKLKGIDILGMANPTPAIIRNAIYETDNDTKIIDGSATFSLKEGMLMNNDLVLNIPFSRLTGRGVLDFLEMTLKYRVTPIIGVQKIGLSVPVVLSGSLLKPEVAPDVSGLLTQGLDDLLLDNAPVRAVTDTVGSGLKAIPGLNRLLEAMPGGDKMRKPGKAPVPASPSPAVPAPASH